MIVTIKNPRTQSLTVFDVGVFHSGVHQYNLTGEQVEMVKQTNILKIIKPKKEVTINKRVKIKSKKSGQLIVKTKLSKTATK